MTVAETGEGGPRCRRVGLTRIMFMLGEFGNAVGIVLRAAPRLFAAGLSCSAVMGALPAAALYTNSRLVASLVAQDGWWRIGVLILLSAVLAAVAEVVETVSSFVEQSLEERATRAVQEIVARCIAGFPDLRVHEQADLRELAVLAAKAADHAADLVGRGFTVLFGLASGVPVLLLTATVAWWVPAVLLVGLVPTVWLRARTERSIWTVNEHTAGTLADLGVLRRVLTQPEFAKDLRTFSMQSGLLSQWSSGYGSILKALFSARKRGALRLGVSAAFTGACLVVPFVVVAQGFRGGRYGVADLVVLFGALINVSNAIGLVSYNAGGLLAATYALGPLRRFQRACESAARLCSRFMGRAAPGLALELRNVELRYAQAGSAALAGLSFELRQGEIVAIVGPNGAGKSTWLKLCCGLLAPTAGSIGWSRAEGRRDPKIVAVFQDCTPLPLTVLEALVTHDEQAARRNLEAVGLGFLANSLDLPLSSERTGGRDLSGGQWQRLAIARAMVHAHDADLLVFDEPTSALDPESEARVMQMLLDMAQGRSALVVSHRLALTRFVDRIVVLDHGHIIEQGSHEALMRRGGRYATMFEHQAHFYR